MTARYGDSDDRRNLAGRVFALVVLALFKLSRFLASALSPLPGSAKTYWLGSTCLVFVVLAGLLARRRRRSDVVSALAATVLVSTFDMCNEAGENGGSFVSANLVV